ncbi:uncharacterized protein LOC135475855 [Liolophura sinensis]|uniref:uncharacterized protein LOC135475855 n=1 Tax=Liolophura sinensis TaxID=3198878 RepID=UPI0031591F68
MDASATRYDKGGPLEDLLSPDGETNNWLAHNIRCVDEDYISAVVVAEWKANVEPVTYRYVPNNGSYRKTKNLKRDDTTFERKVPLSWHQRKLQKEIQRDLKRGLTLQRPLISKPEAENVASRNGQLNRERSKSDVTLEYNAARAHQRLSPVLLPALDDSLVLHAVNDKFIETFTSRLSALDEEIQRDAKLYRKSRPEDELKGAFTRARIKDSRVAPLGAEALTNETFSIKPLRGRPQLRPLEKVTPQQRITEDLGKMAVAQLKYTTVSKGEIQNVPMDNNIFNASNARLLQNVHYKLSGEAVDGADEEEVAALTKAITATKVIPNNKYSITKLLSTKKSRKNSDKDSVLSEKLLASPRITTHVDKDYNSNTHRKEETLDGEFFSGISGKHMAVPLAFNG